MQMSEQQKQTATNDSDGDDQQETDRRAGTIERTASERMTGGGKADIESHFLLAEAQFVVIHPFVPNNVEHTVQTAERDQIVHRCTGEVQ